MKKRRMYYMRTSVRTVAGTARYTYMGTMEPSSVSGGSGGGRGASLDGGVRADAETEALLLPLRRRRSILSDDDSRTCRPLLAPLLLWRKGGTGKVLCSSFVVVGCCILMVMFVFGARCGERLGVSCCVSRRRRVGTRKSKSKHSTVLCQ